MTGGLMQLVAYGAQDIYLTGNPMITYFKVVYRRHTNFAIESIQQTFNGTADFGNRVTSLISRNGDLINAVYLEATLPNLTLGTTAASSVFRWTDNVGHHLLQQVEVEIGGQLIDRQYSDWLEIWSQLSVNASQRPGYLTMIGQDPVDADGQPTGLQAARASSTATTIKGRKIYVPLQFWFCRNIGLSLPLIALQYHEVKINIQFQTLANLWINKTTAGAISTQALSTSNSGTSLSNVALWVDYIYLDTDERRRFAQVSHEYLIEQLQFTGVESVAGNTTDTATSIKLNFNHPVKELVWAVRYDTNVVAGHSQWSNFTPIMAPTIVATNPSTVTSPPTAVTDAHALAGQSHVSPLPFDRLAVSGSNADDGFKNSIVTAKLQLNGQDRFYARDGSYFNLVQTKQAHTCIPASPGINVYSFALKPEDHQPSGSCNFSRIDNATLQITVKAGLAGLTALAQADLTTSTKSVYVYAVNYNVLRIMSGMGGLAYSN